MRRPRYTKRAGAASLDYVLILGFVVIPAMIFLLGRDGAAHKIMRLAYEMVCVLVSWPFL